MIVMKVAQERMASSIITSILHLLSVYYLSFLFIHFHTIKNITKGTVKQKKTDASSDNNRICH